MGYFNLSAIRPILSLDRTPKDQILEALWNTALKYSDEMEAT